LQLTLHLLPPDLPTRSTHSISLNLCRCCECLNSLDHGLQCIYNLATTQPPSASLNVLHRGLLVHLHTHYITASNLWISELARLQLTCSALSSLDRSPLVHLKPCSIMASKCISELAQTCPSSVSPNLHDHGLRLYLSVPTLSVSHWISTFTLSWPRSASPTNVIMALKCISQFTRFRPLSASPNSLYHSVDVHKILASNCIWKCTQSACLGAPQIALEYHLQPDWVSVDIQIHLDSYYVPYHNVANFFVIVKDQCETKTNIIDQMPCSYGTLRTTTVRIPHQVSSLHRTLCSSLSCYQSLRQICTEVTAAPKFDYPISQIS